MRRRLASCSLLFAWICANGAIWDVAQVAAWTRMFAGYLQTATPTEALSETFDASKPCPVCRAIAKARGDEQRGPLAPAPASTAAAGKLLLACEVPTPLIFRAPAQEWVAAPPRVARTRREPLPLRPPRA